MSRPWAVTLSDGRKCVVRAPDIDDAQKAAQDLLSTYIPTGTAVDRVTALVPVEAPFSEVCMHLRVAGKPVLVEPLANERMAQLYTPDGEQISFAILRGEAGLRSKPRYVTVHELDRVYGGPEEGGWWYDTGRVVYTRELAMGEKEDQVVDDLEREFPNEGYRYSVRPRGTDYSIQFDDAPGEDFPAVTPHYE